MSQHPEPPSTDLAVAAYVRPTVFAEQIEETLRRLERLDADGRVALSRTRVWPAEIPLRSPCSDRSILEAYREFAEWADRTGATIEPPFGVRRTQSLVTDEERTVLRTPVLCLAVYEDGTLVAVYPHRDDEGTHSVADAVAALERVDPRQRGGSTGDDADADGCPDCGAPVANVQGLSDCVACAWTGTGRGRRTSRTPEPAGGLLQT